MTATRRDTSAYADFAHEIRVIQTDRPVRYFFYGLSTGLLGAILYLIGGYVDTYAGATIGDEGIRDGLRWDNVLEQVGRIMMFAGPAVFWMLAFLRWGKERADDAVHERDDR
jgi:hypothetical protein